MDSSSDYSMVAMEEEEVPVAKRWSIGNWMIAMEEEEVPVAVVGDGRGSSSLLEERDSICRILVRISKLKTGYHQGKGTERDQVAAIWRDIKKLKEEDCISTEQMEALMSHFRSMLGYFAGYGFQPTSYIDRPFRDYCHTLLREVAVYSDQEKELIQIGYPRAMYVPIDICSPFRETTAEKDLFDKDMFPYVPMISEKIILPYAAPLPSKSFPMVAYETNGTGEATTSSGGLIIPYMLKHFVRFIIFAVLSYAALYPLLPDDGGRGITHVVPFWMMAFQVYFMAIIVYSYFRRSE